MNPKVILRAARAGYLALPLAAALSGCLPMGDRVAGSSTEAGNAGGKLSLAGGEPAEGVEVALVAREFVPDTAAAPGADDVPGAYYRTRTDADGRYAFAGVVPGDYRVMALRGGLGATLDSLAVRGGDTAVADRILRPLGAIRGVAKVAGEGSSPSIWVRCKATLRTVRKADTAGAFRLDSLPEGVYELQPTCFSCRTPAKPVRVRVQAGRDTSLADTLMLYPDYFQAFPPADSFSVRAANLPFTIGGKTHRGDEDTVMPIAAYWTWDGAPLAGADIPDGGGDKIGETQISVDSGFFRDREAGTLRLSLRYPDTLVTRQWRISLDRSAGAFAMRLVRAAAAARLIGGDHPLWRFRILDTAIPASADMAFWGLDPAIPGEAPPQTVELAVDPADGPVLEGTGPMDLTFILVPDPKYGGRVFRPRRDERLADFASIRLLDRGRLGLSGDLEPHMLPGALRLDRKREDGSAQSYLISSNGKITETLQLPKGGGFPGTDSLLFFYRRAPAGSTFAWEAPARGAEKAWAVDLSGRAWRLDAGAGGEPVQVPPEALRELADLIGPMAGDPPSLPDTSALPDTGAAPGGRPQAYAWFGGRGRLGDAGKDTLLAALDLWFVRAGLAGTPAFALPDSLPFRYLSFRADDSGFRYTGDTLLLERDPAGPDRFRESLTAGSPGRSADSASRFYSLRIQGDSLIAAADTYTSSRLFGTIGTRAGLFALAGLPAVSAGETFGLPSLAGGDPGLSGVWDGRHDLTSKVLVSPMLRLVGKPRGVNGGQDAGYLFTAEGGLERKWRFATDQLSAEGWDKQ